MPEKKNHAWSYSSINIFSQCPRRWYGEKIEGFRQETSEQLEFGNKAHKEAELFGKEGKSFSKDFEFMEPFVKPLIDQPGEKHFELRLALTNDLEPCSFFDNENCWWRGICDFVNLIPNEGGGPPKEAVLIDYKTGASSKFADKKQLELLSLGLFNTFPSFQTVKSALLFVMLPKSKSVISGTYNREDMEKYWKPWDKLVSDLQFALVQGQVAFPRKKNALCKSWCPVTTCSYNGNFSE